MVPTSLAAALALFPGQGAAAEQLSAPDPARDVVSVRIDAGPDLQHIARRRPIRAHGDIVSLRALHAHERVIVRLGFRNIRETGHMWHTFVFATPGRRFTLDIDNQGSRVVDTSLNRCVDLKVRVRSAMDRMRVSVPRSCLDRPRWVRVGAETSTPSNRSDFHYDDALQRGRNDSNWLFEGPALGSRLHRAP
jgi:hypothetical protein